MWVQGYSPILKSVTLSPVVALLPVAVMFILIGGFRKSASVSSFARFSIGLILESRVPAKGTANHPTTHGLRETAT